MVGYNLPVMTKLELVAAAFVVALCGCGGGTDAPVKRAMPMEGVVNLPVAKTKQVATYRCKVQLQTGEIEVKEDRRAGKDEETAWKNLSSKLKNGEKSYEVVVEQGEKNAKGHIDWALVTLIESEASTGRQIRKIPVQEFWGAHAMQTPRALMLKEGHFQFFIQFWPAE
jgi:hypothetical protein